jgi:hypothetical protein
MPPHQPDAAESVENYSETYHKPHTVDELTERNVRTIIQLEEAAKANRTWQIASLISLLDFAAAPTLSGRI